MSNTLSRLLLEGEYSLQSVFLSLTRLSGVVDPCRIMYRKDEILGFRKKLFAALFLTVRSVERGCCCNY